MAMRTPGRAVLQAARRSCSTGVACARRRGLVALLDWQASCGRGRGARRVAPALPARRGCRVGGRTRASVRLHDTRVMAANGTISLYGCGDCDKTCKNLDGLTQHVAAAKHTNAPTRRFVPCGPTGIAALWLCGECGQTFLREEGLASHQRGKKHPTAPRLALMVDETDAPSPTARTIAAHASSAPAAVRRLRRLPALNP